MVAVVFGFNLVLAVLFVGVSIFWLWSMRKMRSLRLLELGGELPHCDLEQGMRFHLFLSHVWTSGQDQVAVIKRQLQLLLPGIRVFLDVDDMQDVPPPGLEPWPLPCLV